MKERRLSYEVQAISAAGYGLYCIYKHEDGTFWYDKISYIGTIRVTALCEGEMDEQYFKAGPVQVTSYGFEALEEAYNFVGMFEKGEDPHKMYDIPVGMLTHYRIEVLNDEIKKLDGELERAVHEHSEETSKIHAELDFILDGNSLSTHVQTIKKRAFDRRLAVINLVNSLRKVNRILQKRCNSNQQSKIRIEMEIAQLCNETPWSVT